MADPDGEADLYRLDPAGFTAARDALAKQLRAGGDGTEADRVKKLRRPSLTAWALNQAAHDHPDLIGAALDAGETLRAATRQAIEGDASALRPAQQAERRAVAQAVFAATDILEAAGHQAADAARMKMAETIRAAFIDGGVATQLRQGVVDRDHRAAGFDLDGGADPSAPQPVTTAPPAEGVDEGAPPPDQVARQRAKRRAEEAEEQARRAGRLRDAAARAEREANKATHAAEQAERRAAEARQAAEQAERRAADAERDAADAARRAADAERDAAEAGERAADAERDAADAARRAADAD